MSSRKKLIEVSEEHASTIDEYISKNRQCKTGMVLNAFEDDKIKAVKVYNLPRDLLRLNPNNGRFKVELDIIRQDRLKDGKPIELDNNDSADIKTIQDMIKGEYPKSVERKNSYCNLLTNIKEVANKTGTNGQEMPGLITHDGVLINGNRRWIVMEELATIVKKRGEPLQFGKIRVGRLSANVTAYDLWKNEAKEQISRESREEYDYVNSALEIKRGYDLLKYSGLRPKQAKTEIAKTLYGRNVKDVEAYLEFLDVADLFLETIGKKEQYTYLGESGGEKGIVTILQDASKERQKFQREGMDLEELEMWFRSVCAFCIHSKAKHKVTFPDGRQRHLTFGHREYRVFQKKIIDQPTIRRQFLKSPELQFEIESPTKDDAVKLHRALQASYNTYDIRMEINTPVTLLKSAKEALSKVGQDLTGARKPDIVKEIRTGQGLDHISDIKTLIREIEKKVKVARPSG